MEAFLRVFVFLRAWFNPEYAERLREIQVREMIKRRRKPI